MTDDLAPLADSSTAHPPDKTALRLWLRLLSASRQVEKTIRSRLASEFAATLPRFDVLAALERANAGVQLGELSQSLRVSNGNVTGIVARLVAEGLVERQVDPNDARIARVSLTSDGRAAFHIMARAHEAWIEELFGGLPPADQLGLLDLLTRLRRSLAEPAASLGGENL